MKILVYGGGAVGLGIASCLIKSGVDTTILARRNTKQMLEEHGLFRKGIFGEFHFPAGSFRAIETLAEAAQFRYDYVLVCVKSFDTPHAAADLLIRNEILGDYGKIVLFQNGWGNTEIMAGHFPKESIYNARVITGFVRDEPHTVRITVHAEAIAMGSLFMGTLHEELGDLAKAISAGGIECSLTPDIGKIMWAKMLYNCALNPLGAIFSVPYGRLAENPESRELMNAIIREVYAVMGKHGFSTLWNTPEEYCEKFYTDLVRLTATHESSMLQDIRAERRTEIEALNGEVVRLGEIAGIGAPVNLTLTRMIRFIDSRHRTQD
jgi:2-dehydropantoate 2-reductase